MSSEQRKRKLKPMKPYSREWERLANQHARLFAPTVYPCRHCGGPTLKGYCCTRCGSATPEPQR